MKRIFVILFLFLSLSLQAQSTGALSKMDQMLSQAARVKKMVTLPQPVNRWNFPPATPYYKQFARLESTIQRRISISNEHQLYLVNYTHKKADTRKYQLVMKDFLSFKKQADPFLYYQIKDSRTLSTEEIRQWLERIYAVKQQLASLRTIVSVQEKSVQESYQYLNEVLRLVAPDVALLAVPQPYQSRKDRLYKDEEFFLHPPQNSFFIRTLHKLGIYVGNVKPLPKDLRIAIFNDNYINIDELQKWQKTGKLFPTEHVLFSKDAYELLGLITRGTFEPDVIITDVCSRTGTGGVTLTQELRNSGYNGIILALTGFREEEISGELFMDYGFDGIISNPDIYMTSAMRTRIIQALQNYFYYRNLQGWIR